MPTNHYFQGGRGIGDRNEQDLMQQLTNEIIQMIGADFVYIPRDIVNVDELFHEDTISTFTKNYLIEMQIDNYQEFLGVGDAITKFGFQVNDQMKLHVSRERFRAIVQRTLPVEGDLVYYPVSQHLFEIKYVDDKTPLYPLGTRTYFSITCEAYKYSNETINTGTEADDVVLENYNDGTTITDVFAKNDELEDIANNKWIDFSESNPFGEP